MSEEIVQEDAHVEDSVEEVEESEQETDTEEAGGNDPYANLSDEELRSRLKKAETALVKNKKKSKQQPINSTQPEPEQTEVPEWGQKLLESETKRQFQAEHKLSPDTVDAVFRANGGEMPTAEQMESDDLIKTVVRSFQAKARVAGNTPSGGSAPVYKGKTFADVVTDKEATAADKQAAFEATKKKYNVK